MTKKVYDGAFFSKGKRTLLRPLEESDIPQIYRWVNDPEIRRNLMIRQPMSETAERQWHAKLHERGNAYSFAICLLSGELVGVMSLENIDHINGTAVTGAFIGRKDLWGQGYGSDAKMQLLAFAFLTLNLRKICSTVKAFNGRSIGYNKRCGYIEEGRRAAQHYVEGVYYDEVLLAVFKDAWLPLWQQYLG